MDFDLLYSWATADIPFRIVVLMAIALAYVVFELVVARGSKSKPQLATGELAAEPFQLR